MSTGKIENQILDAVQTIVDNSIAHAGFDRTIQAQIARCANENQGKYVIKYQDGLFYAYSSNIETIYKKGDNVYILIPRNDMSEIKTILGLVSNLGADYITNIEEEDKYETVGNDCVKKQESVGLCSYIKSQEIDLYNINSTPAFREGFEFDLEAFEFYLKKSNYFRGGAYFRTALPEEQRYSGDYGIAYELVFKDATGSEKIITYKINIDDMEGNPYLLTVASKQYCIWEIDTENFIRLQRVYIFQNSFPNQKNDKVNDIFITNVELMGANAIPTDEVSNCSISIITKKGIYFDDNDLNTDTRTVEPVIRAKGNIIASNSSLLKYYWFKENNSVNYNSILFQRYGGPGWECINDFNTIEDGVREWLPGNSILSIQKSEATAKENTYKCVVVYNEKTILTKEFTIYNNSSSYDVTIQASNGTQFYYDLGETTLTCLINGQEQTGDDYQYDWSIVNNFGEFSSIIENSNKILVQAKTINNYSLYKCIVSYKNNKIGKAEVTIKNSLEGGYAYTAIINNGNQIFKYDEKGISPASEAANMPMIIQPLDFTVYDDNGAEVPQSAIGNQNVEWWIPAENTMIDVLNSYGAPERIEDGYEIYSNTYSIGFDILKTYNPNNNNNTILLKVFYKDKKLIAKTNFSFLKEGENGTNGSEFVCRLVPNTTDVTIPKNVILTYNETGSADDYLLNYNRPAGKNNIWLNAELYHNGVNIFRGNSSGISNEDIETNAITLTWSILRNKYDYDNKQKITYQDDTNLAIDAETGAVSFSATEYSNPANIIKCTIIYNNVEYVATMPIIISRVTQGKYSLALKENTGFLSAMYTTDGQNPIYNNIAPYELILKEDGEEITKNKNLSYDWSIKGRIYLSEWQSDSNLIIRNIASPSKVYEKTADSTYQSGKTYYKYENNQYIQLIAITDYPIGGTVGTNIYEARIINNIKYIKPKDTFDGMCVSNGIYCSVKNNNVEIANIHIPVYLYLNRYGNAAINGWDGNTISINDEAGVILSPQVGAGQKESDNSFTGVLMGSVKESGSKEIETGLFGYHAGQRTIKLDSKTGSAEFGTEDSGKIVIAPNEGAAGHAYLRSGDYELSYAHVAAGTLFNNLDLYFQKDGNIYTELKRDKDYTAGQTVVGSNIYKASSSGSGMEIDLTDPHIRFGSGKFRVDSDGSVYASEYALTSTVDSIRDELQNTKDTVTDLEDSVRYFEVSSDIAAINIPCDTLQIPISKTIEFPINFIGTFKGVNIPLFEGTEIGQCNITIEGNHTGLTLTKNFSEDSQQIIISADNTHIISDLINDYTITFIYKESATKTYEVKKQFSVVLAIQGKNGAPGEQGPAGPAGKDGTSVTVKGSYNTLQELLNAVTAGTITPTLGDSYIIGNNLFIYTNEGNGNGKLSTDWKDVGQFKGTDAKRCFIVASTEIFRSDDGGSIYTPSEIILTPYFQSVEYQGWSYSTQGGADNTFMDISAPIPSGLSLNTTTKKLTIQNDCELFDSNLTLVFKCRSNDGTTFDTISISKFKDGVDGKQGPQGPAGENGKNGVDGNGIKAINYYYKTTTTQTAPAAKDITSTTLPTMSSVNKFLWQKEVISYTDPKVANKVSVLLLSIWGDTGKRILTTVVDYQISSNGNTTPTGTWSPSVPSVDPGKFLWTRTTIKYTEDGTSISDTTVSYAVAYRGTNGVNGTSVSITSKEINYRYNYSSTNPNEQSSSGYSAWSTSIPAAPKGSYLWTRTIVNYSNGQNTTSYSVAYQSIDGVRGYSIWTTSANPTTPNYTFKISDLKGPEGEIPKIGETILQTNRYQYTITEISTTTVKAGTKVDLKGTTGISATNVISGNDAEAIACSPDETVIQETIVTIPFTGYLGSTKQAVKITKINEVTSITAGTSIATGVSISGYTAGTTATDGVLKLKFEKGSNLGKTKNNVITIHYTCNSQTFIKYFSWTKTLDSDLKIGGRNYFQDSDIFTLPGTGSTGITPSIEENGLWKIVVAKNNGNYLSWVHENTIEENFSTGDTFTFSAIIKAETGSVGIPTIYFKPGMDYTQMKSLKGNNQIGTDFETIYYTGTWKDSETINFHFGFKNCSGTFYIDKIKFEKGNQATDWTAAPEDINESIGNVSDIANKANLAAGEAKSDAKNALDQSGEAARKADGALENVKQVENKTSEMKVKATTFEYYIVKYEYKEEKKGNLFKSNLIYYSKNNNQYTKVRPDLDKTNHLTNTYYIKDDSSIQKPSSDLSESVVYKNKPQWQDGFRIYRRTVITYNDNTQARSDWDLIDDYQTVDDIRYLDGNEVLKTMRGTNNIFYNSDGFYCYDGATKNDSTHAIILNHNGICFQERSSIKDPWPEPTSVWNINGTFDAKQINVINLTANAIVNGILTLGSAAQDGGIIINDDQGTTKFELNSQRFCCHLNNGGYVLIGKDIGIQVLSSENEVQWGSSLVWTSITGNGTIKYENNVNYYLTKGNFNSLIIPETPEKIIPNGKTVYTINCGNIIEVKQQKIMDSLFFGDYIQTININTIDSKGKAHKGVAFIAKQ